MQSKEDNTKISYEVTTEYRIINYTHWLYNISVMGFALPLLLISLFIVGLLANLDSALSDLVFARPVIVPLGIVLIICTSIILYFHLSPTVMKLTNRVEIDKSNLKIVITEIEDANHTILAQHNLEDLNRIQTEAIGLVLEFKDDEEIIDFLQPKDLERIESDIRSLIKQDI